jgi:hypothetical protein
MVKKGNGEWESKFCWIFICAKFAQLAAFLSIKNKPGIYLPKYDFFV